MFTKNNRVFDNVVAYTERVDILTLLLRPYSF